MALLTLVADRGDAGERLDLVLRRHLASVPAATRTRLQSWIAGGCVAVNGTPVKRAAARLAIGDAVAVTVPDAPARRPVAADNGPLSVLYEDRDLLAIDKPAGVVVHPAYKQASGTLMDRLVTRARQWPEEQRPSCVGRLDKGTSGVVIVAKSSAVHASLQRTLSQPDSIKLYLAVVYGRGIPGHGRIDAPLAGDPSDRRRRTASAAGKPSVTDFARLAAESRRGAGAALLQCRLHTGRRHQIRVHLAARGWPIVGDPTYGVPLTHVANDTVRNFPRPALHAWRTVFTHPVTRERIHIEAPLPEDFVHLLTATGLDNPWNL